MTLILQIASGIVLGAFLIWLLVVLVGALSYEDNFRYVMGKIGAFFGLVILLIISLSTWLSPLFYESLGKFFVSLGLPTIAALGLLILWATLKFGVPILVLLYIVVCVIARRIIHPFVYLFMLFGDTED